MNQRIICASALAFLLALPGCVKTGGGSGTSGESLSQTVARHDQQIQTLLSQVGQVEQVLPGQAEMWSQMQTMRQELNSVHGKIDDMQMQISGDGSGELGKLKEKVARMETIMRQMASQLAVNVDSLDTASPDSSGGSSSGYTTPPSDPGTGAPSSSSGASGGDTAQILYNAGISSFDQRKYQDAVVSFKDFYSTYPKHSLASNACFWEGESYFQLKDYARAALAYQNVIEKYPGSPKFQSAMLKQGIALSNAGKKDAGTQRLQELVKRYPNSPEATRAKQFLQGKK